jgi:hypothetical protein
MRLQPRLAVQQTSSTTPSSRDLQQPEEITTDTGEYKVTHSEARTMSAVCKQVRLSGLASAGCQ